MSDMDEARAAPEPAGSGAEASYDEARAAPQPTGSGAEASYESSSDLTPLEREAHAWIRRLVSGTATEADAEALRRWCGLSPAHAAAFAVASQVWQAFGPAGRSLQDGEKAALAGRGDSAARRGRSGRRAFLGGALAAASAGILVVRPPLGLWPSLSELRSDFYTGVGERRSIAVASGVSIEMNSRTSISLGGEGHADVVELIAGEASFTLPDHRSTPFTVVAAGGRISATNAHFDMRLTESGACVTCLADQVRVDYRGRTVTLDSRRQIRYGDDGLGVPVMIDPAVVSAWRDGLMIFEMTPFSEVVKELNRYQTRRLILLNPDLARIPVNGRFRTDRPDEALAQIERAFGVHRRTLPGGIILLS